MVLEGVVVVISVVPSFCGCCTEILWVAYWDFGCLSGNGGLWGCLRLWWLAMHWLGLVAGFSAPE